MPDIRHFRIEIETPDGTLGPAEIAVSDEPLKLADLAPPLHTLTDGIVDLAVKRAGREGRTLSCGPGCGVCCCQLVPLTPAEVFFMVERILAMPIAERAKTLKRFEANERAIDDAGLTPRIRGLGDTNDNDLVARDYFHFGLFCPFNVNRSCSIHAWRPIACREYNVTSSPALCADPFTNTISSIGLHRRLSAGLTRFCSHAAGLPAGLVPMPLMFDYHESHREAAQRTWPGIELFKQALDFVLGTQK